ncbi:MAG TPA: hypothetical protein GX717_08960 [Clostridiaceae bacterium]|nr:hypothetical protein [Clostridiaceae bacterium]
MYVVDKDDIDTGVVRNAVTVTGRDSNGNLIPPVRDGMNVLFVPFLSMSVEKTTQNDILVLGDTIIYTFVIGNTGRDDIYTVVAEDILVDL